LLYVLGGRIPADLLIVHMLGRTGSKNKQVGLINLENTDFVAKVVAQTHDGIQV
jgi:hypothetical protein